jgi:glycosyltransferase involved in cell wall biosynthesis
LVHAFAALVARDVDAELVLVGGGPLHEPLEREVMKLGIADRVVFRGWASEGEVLTELARADLFVLASVAEGLPVVIMEALAMAVPVVAPCIAGIPELIEHERSGLLFYASDRDGLATEMERGLTDDELRHRLMREGATRVTSLHTMAKVVEPLVQRLRRRGPRDTAPRSKPTG